MRTDLKRTLPYLGALLVCLLARASAAEESFQLVVNAGEHDRAETPVCVPVAVGDEARSVRLRDPAGNHLPGQLTAPGLLDQSATENRRLHFILPSLKKGRSIRLRATVSDEPARGGFRWQDTPGKYAELSCAGRPVLRYMYEALDPARREQTYKVFHHVYDPAGTRFVTKGPGGKYTHHRGLFFGFNRISYDGHRCDTWHCGGQAHQSHEGFLAAEAGPVLGRHRVAVDWHASAQQVFAREQRELTVYRVPGGHLIEFASRLSTTGGTVKLDGDPQHAGFQFRAAQEVADGDQKLTCYLRPDGPGKPGETRNWPGRKDFVNLPWNAMSFVIDGCRYTAVYLDKPTNPKPARYSERSYGRFGSYFEYELEEGKDLEVNYRVWLQEGEMTVEQAAALSADFVDPVEVAVSTSG